MDGTWESFPNSQHEQFLLKASLVPGILMNPQEKYIRFAANVNSIPNCRQYCRNRIIDVFEQNNARIPADDDAVKRRSQHRSDVRLLWCTVKAINTMHGLGICYRHMPHAKNGRHALSSACRNGDTQFPTRENQLQGRLCQLIGLE